jgi:small subunit ribosomal protein S6
VRGLRLYDILMIIDPRLSEEEVAQLSNRLGETLTGLGGEMVGTEPWGRRRLAFELNKQREGSYLLTQIRALPAVVREYERQLKLNEAVFRFMTTRVDPRSPGLSPAEPTATTAEPGIAEGERVAGRRVEGEPGEFPGESTGDPDVESPNEPRG